MLVVKETPPHLQRFEQLANFRRERLADLRGVVSAAFHDRNRQATPRERNCAATARRPSSDYDNVEHFHVRTLRIPRGLNVSRALPDDKTELMPLLNHV